MLSTYKTVLTKKSQLNSDTYLYHFDLLEPKEISFRAGQYLILKIPSDKGPVSRLYSIATPDTDKNSFELIIGIIPGGLASNYIFSLQENAEVTFQGPAGVFGIKENDLSKVFLVTGTGIAPVKSMLESSQLPIVSCQMFWGLKTYKDLYLFNEIKKFNPRICLSREQNLNMIPEADRNFFDLGHIDSCYMKQFNPTSPFGLRGASSETTKQLNDFEYYLCGGRNTVESLKQFLLSKNIALENIYFEKF